VWWFVDRVMGRDRRAWWMRHWPLGTNSIQTLEVFKRHDPILLVGHDADDGLWQLIGPTATGPRHGQTRMRRLHRFASNSSSLTVTQDASCMRFSRRPM
jgi:hypothetical protein